MKKNIIVAASLIIVGAGCFYGGTNYPSAKGAASLSGGARNFQDFQNMTQEERQKRMQKMGINGNGANRQGRVFTNGQQASSGGFASGEIISKDDSSVTVKLGGLRQEDNQNGSSSGNGGSKIIFFSGSTKISKTIGGSPEDLAVGKNITASGQANSDGSIVAESIQLRPEAE